MGTTAGNGASVVIKVVSKSRVSSRSLERMDAGSQLGRGTGQVHSHVIAHFLPEISGIIEIRALPTRKFGEQTRPRRLKIATGQPTSSRHRPIHQN